MNCGVRSIGVPMKSNVSEPRPTPGPPMVPGKPSPMRCEYDSLSSTKYMSRRIVSRSSTEPGRWLVAFGSRTVMR